MKANPGGEIDAADIIGRDALIKTIWDALNGQSLLLTAERRLGKTTILKKMRAQPPEHFVCIYQDLEGITSPQEFVVSVREKLRPRYNWINKTTAAGANFLNRFAGAEVQGVKLPQARNANWKSDLVSHIKKAELQKNQKLVFFWDELPLMLYNIKKTYDMAAARDVLDALRNLRQETQVRMILTGSVGLHHVITDLHSGGNANAPVNDLRQIEVVPLTPDFGKELALQLLNGEGIQSDNLDELAAAIAVNADYIPYYIHHLVIELKEISQKVDASVLQSVTTKCISRADDTWNLRYYRERIDTYYNAERAGLAIAILDYLCTQESPLTLDEIFNGLKATTRLTESQRAAVREVARTLELDHYLKGSDTGNLCFRSTLVKRWWEKQR